MKAPARPGELIHTIEVQHRVETGQDGHGQPVFDYVTMDKLYAKVEPLQGRDIEYARQLYHLATYRVTTRYSRHLNNSSRLLFTGSAGVLSPNNDLVLHVGHVLNPELRNIWCVALCSEGADKDA